MTLDIRPPRDAFSVFDAPCTITPFGGTPYAATVSVQPQDETDTVVEGPELWFWTAEAPGVGQGTVVVISEGEDAGMYRVIRKLPADAQLTKVVATKGSA